VPVLLISTPVILPGNGDILQPAYVQGKILVSVPGLKINGGRTVCVNDNATSFLQSIIHVAAGHITQKLFGAFKN
jgi:hypothetical protein